MRYQEFAIIEARRNPELNPKIGLYDALEPYKKDPTIFITYVADVGKNFSKKSFQDKDTRKRGKGISSLDRNISGFKVGINPNSTYNTPNGIYTYPLKEIWEEGADRQNRTLTVPFAGDEPVVHILKATGNIVDLAKYGSDKIDKDIEFLGKKLVTYFHTQGKHSQVLSWEMAKGLLESAKKLSRVRTPGGMFWNATRLTYFALAGAINENHLIPIKQYIIRLKDMEKKAQEGDDFPNYNDEVVRYKLFTKPDDPKRSTLWNKLFREMGYDGVADRAGHEIIHPYEPIQAVFFHTGAFEVIDMVYNKIYNDFDNKNESWLNDISNAHMLFGTFFALHQKFKSLKLSTGTKIWQICESVQDKLNTKLSLSKQLGFEKWGNKNASTDDLSTLPDELPLTAGGKPLVTLYGRLGELSITIPEKLKTEYKEKFPNTDEKEYTKWFDLDDMPSDLAGVKNQVDQFYDRFINMEEEETFSMDDFELELD